MQVINGLSALGVRVDNKAKSRLVDACLARHSHGKSHHFRHNFGRRIQNRVVTLLGYDENVNRRIVIDIVESDGIRRLANTSPKLARPSSFIIEVCLGLLSFFSAEGRIGQDHVESLWRTFEQSAIRFASG